MGAALRPLVRDREIWCAGEGIGSNWSPTITCRTSQRVVQTVEAVSVPLRVCSWILGVGLRRSRGLEDARGR
jgi:hypothetical protein